MLYNKSGLTFVIFQKVMDLNTSLFALIIALNGLKQKLPLINLMQIFVRDNLPPSFYKKSNQGKDEKRKLVNEVNDHLY